MLASMFEEPSRGSKQTTYLLVGPLFLIYITSSFSSLTIQATLPELSKILIKTSFEIISNFLVLSPEVLTVP